MMKENERNDKFKGNCDKNNRLKKKREEKKKVEYILINTFFISLKFLSFF